ncbi:MAG TPA: hypothetical protein VHL78_10450 [Actinomycetota bacterium]|nr:hypothetical protein [Actinomycetota bacterium]
MREPTGAVRRITVEIEFVADGIGGVLHGPGGDGRPFRGWLDLAAALEEARGDLVRAEERGTVR